jgi:nicotinate-nucleotide adenylyltransferase
MAKIGVFGGTFNPIHFGHIHLAVSLKEAKGLDQVIFSPNYASPFTEKKDTLLATPQQRFEMVSLALDGIPGCSATDYEIKRPGLSYTIDLVRYIRSSFCKPQDELFLLLADDVLEAFSRWKNKEELLDLAIPLVGSRKDLTKDPLLDPRLQEIFDKGRVATPIMEISASNIRNRLKKELYCGHLVPQKVLDYILLNKLYL